MLKRIWRHRGIKVALGTMLAWYLRLVKATSRITVAPNAFLIADAHEPFILAMWHGQHFMVPFLKRDYAISVLISRHGDGEVNAIAAAKFGIGLVRGSGAQRADQIRKRGGVEALRAMLAVLQKGENMALTADVPKVARVVGDGIVTLARLSRRPILPIAIVTNRRHVAKSWDRACVCLPFGHCAVEVGEPIHVPHGADTATLLAVRRQLETVLDDIHAKAYAVVGSSDPMAVLPQVAAARARRDGLSTSLEFPA